jgi:hypothetical protein
MAGDFSVPSHTLFFDGYLDAVGRHYTDDGRLCALTAAVSPSRILERQSIVRTTPVEDMVTDFDRDIAKFLHTDSRNRLVFYLVEYFVWYLGRLRVRKGPTHGRGVAPRVHRLSPIHRSHA